MTKRGPMLNDDAVRAELERVDPTFPTMWDTLQRYNDHLYLEPFRRLAESQQARREIYKKTKRIIGPPSDGPYDFDSDCKVCVEVEEIVSNAVKGK